MCGLEASLDGQAVLWRSLAVLGPSEANIIGFIKGWDPPDGSNPYPSRVSGVGFGREVELVASPETKAERVMA